MEKFFPRVEDTANELTAVEKVVTIINAASFLAASGLADKAGPAAHQRIEKMMQDVAGWIRNSGLAIPQDNAAVHLGIDAIEKMFKDLPPPIVRHGGH